MTSTISQRQGYDFYEAPYSSNQFFKIENQVPHSLSQFPKQKDEKSIPERIIDYNLDKEGQKILHITCEIKAGVL